MQTQACLTAFVQNLKRLVSWVLRRRPAALAHARLRADGCARVRTWGANRKSGARLLIGRPSAAVPRRAVDFESCP